MLNCGTFWASIWDFYKFESVYFAAQICLTEFNSFTTNSNHADQSENSSHRIQIPHSKFKSRTQNSNSTHQAQNHHTNFKSSTHYITTIHCTAIHCNIISLFKDMGYVISIFHAIWEAAGLDKITKKLC